MRMKKGCYRIQIKINLYQNKRYASPRATKHPAEMKGIAG
jgi:hypothetical protein